MNYVRMLPFGTQLIKILRAKRYADENKSNFFEPPNLCFDIIDLLETQYFDEIQCILLKVNQFLVTEMRMKKKYYFINNIQILPFGMQ